jgi:hypothetical protein
MHSYEHFWLDPKFWVAVSFVLFFVLVGKRAWAVLVEDLYDAQGKIQRVMQGAILPAWELGACIQEEIVSYDLPSGRYFGDNIVIAPRIPPDKAGQHVNRADQQEHGAGKPAHSVL